MRKITQQDLAKEIHVERTSVGKYEKYDVLPSKEVLFRLAEFFQVSLDYLLGYSSKDEDDKPTPEQKKLISLYENAAPKGQRAAWMVLELAQGSANNTENKQPVSKKDTACDT